MTPRQQRSIEEYSLSGNATQAAIAAGYSKRTAYQAGYRLLKNVEIQSAIQLRKQKASERLEVTRDYFVNELRTNHELARKEPNISASNKALDQIADLLGFKVDKKHITHASDPIWEFMEAVDGKTRGLPKERARLLTIVSGPGLINRPTPRHRRFVSSYEGGDSSAGRTLLLIAS